MIHIHDPSKIEWEYIIIGTGIGGATIGHALAAAGKRVLFCEKGHSSLRSNESLCGNYAESFLPDGKHNKSIVSEIFSRAGRWPEPIEDKSHTKPLQHIPFIGSGTGGSSALYGMAMERFFPADFYPQQNYQHALEANLPKSWPITYSELLPFYIAAERLYRVKGTADPLRKNEQPLELNPPPQPLHSANQELYDFLIKKNHHPYRIPMACEYASGCQGCQGYLCHQSCKNDSSRICLEPAITQYGAHLLDQCNVLKLNTTHNNITSITCNWRNTTLTLRSETVILAAGALQSPLLLLNSKSAEWPHGLANSSDQVGRNLMRHCIDIYTLFPKSKIPITGNIKELAINDLYQTTNTKLGSIQSFGYLPPASLMVDQMEQSISDASWPYTALIFKPIKPLLKSILARVFSQSISLATIMEDLPYWDNRVVPSKEDGSAVITYRLYPHEIDRIKQFRTEMKKILKPYRYMLIKQSENNQRIAHACGTCRFGSSAQHSVLDAMNRAHEITNLYVVDSSFFPSSGGTNPSLTIAANALRVAAHLLEDKHA